ncbi:S8 family serine peptidase [Flavobacterium sp. 7A]|uniref:S8 family serine peptidase n=1 Tax=Flavobacterium sp. 7A TaxID=2940571 RepID=UPI0022271728|nr:S8 family serine peptidase [Flavobacterium sp. 7A]MCW2119270.1 subtilisin family serine protease [Flavobacterium sp. 7A]
MKKFISILLFFISLTALSQEDAWVYFNAKANEKSYYDVPLKMLNQRAIDRRINQSIALDFKDIPINPLFVSQIKATVGITVMAKSKWLNALHVQGSFDAIIALKSLDFVQKVSFANKALNSTLASSKTSKKVKQKKTLLFKDSKINYAYGNSDNQIKMLKGDYVHQQNYTGSGKIIAIIDAGFPGVNTAQPFQRLRDNNKILGGYNFVGRNDNFYAGDHHGTYVLSSMGGYKENALVGTAPDASYYLFITEDNTQESPVEQSYWVEAAEKADSLGVDVISSSLGYMNGHTNPNYDLTYADMTGDATFISKGANIAFSRGMVVVVSAGNEGTESEPHIGAPADAFSVISVGAVTAARERASFSSIGPSYDGRVKPDVMAQGQADVLSDENGNIVSASGTSFSGPIMAGMVACIWQAFPNKTNQQIKDLILTSSDKFTSPTPEYGYGIPNFNLALGIQLPDLFATNQDVNLYPNPTTSFVRISFPATMKDGRVVFYSVVGSKVLEQNNLVPEQSVSLETLASGTYYYKLDFDTYTKSGKIIKL